MNSWNDLRVQAVDEDVTMIDYYGRKLYFIGCFLDLGHTEDIFESYIASKYGSSCETSEWWT